MSYELMATMYNLLSAAHKYIVGFTLEENLYYIIITWEQLQNYFKNDKAAMSKGGMKKIRIKLKAEQKKELVRTGKAIKIGPENLLNMQDKYNNGEHFERIITELLTSEKWEKDSIPFNLQGDIEINGEQIQIKLDGAELTNERTLKRITARA